MRRRILCGIWALIFTINTVLTQPGVIYAIGNDGSGDSYEVSESVQADETDSESAEDLEEPDEDKPMTIAELAKYDDMPYALSAMEEPETEEEATEEDTSEEDTTEETTEDTTEDTTEETTEITSEEASTEDWGGI